MFVKSRLLDFRSHLAYKTTSDCMVDIVRRLTTHESAQPRTTRHDSPHGMYNVRIPRHHTGMRGAGVAPVGCQTQGPACRQPTANTTPVVHLSQPKLVPTLLLGGHGYMCVNNLPKVVTRYASAGDRTRDLPIAR